MSDRDPRIDDLIKRLDKLGRDTDRVFSEMEDDYKGMMWIALACGLIGITSLIIRIVNWLQ